MKFYIVGTVGSGKSTLATRLSKYLDIPIYHLDELVHVPDTKSKVGNSRRSDSEIEEHFQRILVQENFIIEDCLRDRFTFALQKVDKVIFLDLPKSVLYWRVIKRWIKQKIGLEKANYKPKIKMLKQMFSWLNESPREKLQDCDNLIVLRNKREIKRFLESL